METILNIKRRFFRKEKNRFLDAVEEKLTEYGYEFERKQFDNIIKSVNLETKSTFPEYIFLAHYDTGTIIPFWFSWLMKLFGANNQIIIAILSAIILSLISSLSNFDIPSNYVLIFKILYYILLFSFLTMLIPNSNNYDDNTSGVIALLLLAKKCKAHGINNVKFIFVDNEEIGLLGSYAHRKYLEQAQLISTRCKIISLDCVGVGKFPLISRNGPPNFAEPFFKTFQNHYDTSKLIYSIIPLSDDYSFSGYGAINISFVNKAIFPSGYTISNIHSFKDKKIDLHKIEKLTDVLTEIINAEKNV